ncbi:MAG: hypothetical protein ACOYVJ_02490, partial [Nitrospirota bacterium]
MEKVTARESGYTGPYPGMGLRKIKEEKPTAMQAVGAGLVSGMIPFYEKLQPEEFERIKEVSPVAYTAAEFVGAAFPI